MPQSTFSPGPRTDDVTSAEADLVALLRAGDEAAMAQLVDQWSPLMLRVARSFVDSPQSAEDVVQDAWLGMLSGLAKFEGRSSLRTWMFSILVNRARTRGAREARTLPHSPLAARDEPAADDWLAGPGGEPGRTWSSIDAASRWDTAPESVVLSREILLELDRAVSVLPPRQRQVVTMRDVCGMSTEEVCAALDISPANQRVLLHRARAVLREALAEYYRG
ncbi:MAG TPA: sigma-70 family RNA polymerase sigma factor [Streptosporangiaceae bacterium]|nr:sigma-70 family RNA polymerase sigma factor [Streptosporangiaceae bacterium]